MKLRVISVIAVMAVSACSNDGLRDLRGSGDGPDEFLILPSKPLQAPESLSVLPEPTPGGTNITDATPLEDGVAALGGRRGNPKAGIPASDGTLVAHSSRYGTNPEIRTELASADEKFRKRRGRLTQIRLFRTDRYFEVYRRQGIKTRQLNDQYERAGVKTPTSPP